MYAKHCIYLLVQFLKYLCKLKIIFHFFFTMWKLRLGKGERHTSKWLSQTVKLGLFISHAGALSHLYRVRKAKLNVKPSDPGSLLWRYVLLNSLRCLMLLNDSLQSFPNIFPNVIAHHLLSQYNINEVRLKYCNKWILKYFSI